MPQCTRRIKGFTLVELLVVLTVTAVLIAMLTPALSRARESAMRAICLANLRSLGLSLALYADMHKEVIPLGYLDGYKQSSYILHYYEAFNKQSTIQMGRLSFNKIAPDPRVFYCPSMSSNTFRYNTLANPFTGWPIPANNGAHVYNGYGNRPTVDWTWNSSAANFLPASWQKRDLYAGKALVSDFLIHAAWLNLVHREGANVLYADGSAHFVRADPIIAAGFLTIPTTGFQTAQNPTIDAVWAALDKN